MEAWASTTEQQALATEAALSLSDRALNLIGDQELKITGLCLLGILFSWLYTQTRKPFVSGSDHRKLKLRTEAMLAGTLASALLLSLLVTGSTYAKVVVIVVIAPMSGMASPVLFDFFVGFVWPWVRAKLRKKLSEHGVEDSELPTIFRGKKPPNGPQT